MDVTHVMHAILRYMRGSDVMDEYHVKCFGENTRIIVYNSRMYTVPIWANAIYLLRHQLKTFCSGDLTHAI